ncbi:polyketide cyclase [Nocardioides seonyuensis]|uniref:Polyketide cyclase n=1 Tax=Nocardioides seonyuensis TaxID=2518371 RepID=A0A4P7IG70_9ACTN|nr:SRPBCC domain-containing protein [Nocardioides seonyuensis]QBX54711.1 polyketide cyclase [Nocardioides seonyuensis]
MTTTQSPSTDQPTRYDKARIEADAQVPAIHIWRDFSGTPAQLFRAHTDPELFARWIGPRDVGAEIHEWDARDGGSWSYTARGGEGREAFETSFRGCFHTVREDRIVQTFTWEGMPDAVSLETMEFEDLGDGRTRLHAMSLCDSFEGRDQWLASGMEVGVDDGYEAIDGMLADGAL